MSPVKTKGRLLSIPQYPKKTVRASLRSCATLRLSGSQEIVCPLVPFSPHFAFYIAFSSFYIAFSSHWYTLIKGTGVTKLTPLMARVLYWVGTRTRICLPSLIYSHTSHFKLHSSHSAYMFACLMTRIATFVFKLKPPTHEVQTISRFTSYNINKMKLTALPHQLGRWPP